MTLFPAGGIAMAFPYRDGDAMVVRWAFWRV